MPHSVRNLLSPRAIAILGASADLDKLNGRTLKALIEKRYAGAIYPVNPKYGEIAGLRCYPDIASVPGKVDLAIIAVPGPRVADTLRELAKVGVTAAVIFSSGFSEVGGAGVDRERELREAVRETGIRVLGPNCLGLVNAFENVMATFSQFSLGPTPSGPAAFVTQSGALGTSTTGTARRRGLYFGYFVNTGNEIDVTFVDAMREVLADERIRVGLGYIEGLRDGPGLFALGDEAMAMGKPLVITKVGRTGAGARAIASHTGSLAGEDAVFAGILRQQGILRARSDEHLLDLLEVLVNSPLPAGRRVGIVTRSGGAGALMADRAEDCGLEVVELAPATKEALKKVVPAFGSTGNPVDITAQGLVDPTIMRDSLRIVLEDPNVDMVVTWLAFTEKHADLTVDIFAEVKAATKKPFVVSWVGIPEKAAERLHGLGIATLRSSDAAVDALVGLADYAEARRHWERNRAARAAIVLPKLDVSAGAGIAGGRDAQALFAACGIPLVATRFAATADDAVAAARAIGYPVVVKVESRDIPHKTEAQGIALDLPDDAAVRTAFVDIMANAARHCPDARIDGVSVQAMAAAGRASTELVVGLKHDPLFGPIVMAGIGGVFVEVFKDVAFRRAPVTDAEAHRMLDELKGKAMLDGVRGKPPVDRAAVAGLIAAVSRLGAALGPRLAELDLNPVIAGPDGVVAVDWLLSLQE
jgi:acetyltransferase